MALHSGGCDRGFTIDVSYVNAKYLYIFCLKYMCCYTAEISFYALELEMIMEIYPLYLHFVVLVKVAVRW